MTSAKPGPAGRALLSLELTIAYCEEAKLEDVNQQLEHLCELLRLYAQVEELKMGRKKG